MLFAVRLANIEILIAAGVEPISIDQMVRDGATDHAGGYQAKRAGSDADLRGIGDPKLIGENWRPSNCRAQAAREGHGPRHQTRLGIHPEDSRDAHTQEILHQHVACGEQGQDEQWPAAGEQVTDIGFESDPAKK